MVVVNSGGGAKGVGEGVVVMGMLIVSVVDIV